LSHRDNFLPLLLLLHFALPALSDRIQFVEVTKAAGIHFKHYDSRTERRYFVEPLGSGAVFLDYDNDGFQDIYFVNSAPLNPDLTKDDQGQVPRNALYRNNGDGTFTDVTEAAGVGDTGYGMGVCAGDYDNDGFVDLYVTNFGANVFYRNNGDGAFTDVTEQTRTGDARWGASCAFADYDNDGFLDLYVTNYVKYTLASDKVCVNKGIRSYCDPRLYAGELDILYHNNGDGTFTDVTEAAGLANATGRGLAIVWGDYDNDGDVDLYVANDADRNFLFRNSRGGGKLVRSYERPPLQRGAAATPASTDGTFTDVSLIAGVGFSEDGEAENGMGVDFGDYNNDGHLDIIVANFQGQTNTLYRNEGNGLFLDVSYASQTGAISLPYLAWGVNFFDYDHDGYQDLVIANGHLHDNIQAYDAVGIYEQPNLLFHNRKDGTFEEVGVGPNAIFTQAVPLGEGDHRGLEKSSRGLAYADYDNDGDMDLLVTNLHDSPDLLRNDGGNQRPWLILKLIGTRSNRDAIGARVKVTTGDITQMREVRSGSSYLSQSDMRLHFGLGDHQQVDLIEIQWPSGLKERLEKIQANQVLTLIEGENQIR
jgi:hypothetical protein